MADEVIEGQLIKEAIAGNRDALTKLIDSCKDISYNIALGIVKNREDAKDVVQESLMKVVMNIDRFRAESAFSTWLYKIVYNQSLRHIEKAKKQAGVDTEEYKTLFYREDDSKLTDARYAAILEQIEQLPERDKHIVILFYLGEKSIKDIHEITGMSISNIKVNLHRIRKKLSENLKAPL